MGRQRFFRALGSAVGLSLLFVVVYGGANLLAAHWHGVGSFYFAWERHIRFVPLMIVPYMSIDLFFVAAPFVCRNEWECRILVRRVVAAIVTAGACFLAFPLRFAFDRPRADGALGWVFDHFRLLDQPFNQFPSLHIALLAILAPVYLARCRGILRGLLCTWFLLIASSTVLTYQHHIIDIFGGLALAGICYYWFADQSNQSLEVMPNRRVGSCYLAGAMLLGAIAIYARWIGLILLWPAMSLTIAAAAYFAKGPGIYRKSRGQLPVTTWLMLWPVLLGQHASLIYYKLQCTPWDRLSDHLWIGRRLSRGEARVLIESGVTAVLDLTGEFSEAAEFRRLKYLNLPILDLTAPTALQLDQAVEFINTQSQCGIVFVHCKIGYSRTAAVAGAYLLASGVAESSAQAIAMLKAARPSIIIRPEARAAIDEYARRTTIIHHDCSDR